MFDPERNLLMSYPVMWQGLLALKKDKVAVQMHFVSGNPLIANLSLPTVGENGENLPLRIAQRVRMENLPRAGFREKLLMRGEHCILLALPDGKDHMDLKQQTINLKRGFISYLRNKKAAGIVNAPPLECQQPTYVVHVFPTLDFMDEDDLSRYICPDLLHIIQDLVHMFVVIVNMGPAPESSLETVQGGAVLRLYLHYVYSS